MNKPIKNGAIMPHQNKRRLINLLYCLLLPAACGTGSGDEKLADSDSLAQLDTETATSRDSATTEEKESDSVVPSDTESNIEDPTPVTDPESGFATHYWDCCKPHCGWTGNASNPVQSCDRDDMPLDGFDHKSACDGGPAFQCWGYAPWAVSNTLSYGFAAHNGVECGTCFQLEFDGTGHHNPTDPGAATLGGKFMIVQVVNTGGIEGNQFDLLIPGGGVGDFDACTNQWGSDLGERYGGYFLQCRNENSGNLQEVVNCVKEKCNRTFKDKAQLLKGCLWWAEWGSVADNPNLKYGKVDCPPAIIAVSKP